MASKSNHVKEQAIAAVKKGKTIKEVADDFKVDVITVCQWCVTYDVKKGISLRQASKNYNVPLSTVAHWCGNEKIKSKHSRSPTKATDKQLLELIKKKRVISVSELEVEFGYHTNAIRRRLKRLIMNKKIHFTVMPGGGGKVSLLFKGYIDKRLYYIDKSDLSKWVIKKLPREMPPAFKRALTQKLNDAGIPFEFKKHDKKALVMEKKLYDKLKKQAHGEGISIAKLVERKTA
jgi:transposase